MPFFLLSFFLDLYNFAGGFVRDLFLNMAAGLIDQSLGADELVDIYKLTAMNNVAYKLFWSVINIAYSVVEPFGYAMITVYFLMYLFDAATKEQITVDSLIKVIIQLVLVIALIKNIDTIVNTFLGFSDYIITSIKDVAKTESSGMTGIEIVEEWRSGSKSGDNDFTGTIFFQAILVWVIHWIAIAAIAFAIIQRALELGWRLVLSPIGLANCFDGGMNSRGIQYLKTLVVVILSSAAIFITATIGMSLSASILQSSSIMLAVMAQLGTAGACVGVSGKIRDLA